MRYPELIKAAEAAGGRLEYIGETRYGYPIPMISKGSERKGGVLIVGGVHAREYITARLLCELTAAYSGDYPIDVVPSLNIDGAILSEHGLDEFALRMRERTRLVRINDGSTDFTLWKANIAGVDINTNFDAGWGEGEDNLGLPAPSGYVGPRPFSEPETRAARDLMERADKDYALAVAYHSKGEEVYWGFRNDTRYKREAARVARALGYKLKKTPRSAGGLKDYWTLTTGRLGLTIEVGSDVFPHPYPLSELSALVRQQTGMFGLYAEIAEKLYTKDYAKKGKRKNSTE